MTAPLPGRQPGHHLVDPLALLRPGKLGGNQHDHPLTVAVGGNGAAAAWATPDLHDRFAYARSDTTASMRDRGEHTHVGNLAGGCLPLARGNFTITAAIRPFGHYLQGKFG